MTKPISIARDFGCCITMCNQTMVIKNRFFKCCFGQNLVFNKNNQENSRIFWVLNVSSTKFPIFWLKFAKNLTPKKWKRIKRLPFVSIKNWFKWIPIDSIWLFDVYDLLSLHFVSWYGHKDLPTCQNIGKK